MAIIFKNVFDITDNVFDILDNVFDITENIGGFGILFISLNNLSLLDFQRGREIIIREPLGQRQIAGFTNANQAKIQDYGSVEKYFEIIISKIDESSYNSIHSFFALSYVNYTENPFTFVKEDHTTFERVRLWKSSNFNLPQVKGGLYNMKLLLKGEV